MQENKLSEQLDDYENLISEFKSKMATLRQHEDELNQKKTIWFQEIPPLLHF